LLEIYADLLENSPALLESCAEDFEEAAAAFCAVLFSHT
jgi:hypothetical protein